MMMSSGTSDPMQVQAVAQKAKRALKTVYQTTGSYVQMLPWVDDSKKYIMNIYTKLRLAEQIDTTGKPPIEEQNMESDEEMYEKMFHFKMMMNRYKKIKLECEMKSYEEIFTFKTQLGTPIKRVILSGSAGIGKTTLIDKIAYDWALGESESLKKYELVFVLKMRSLKQSSDLVDAIFDQLLDKNSVDQSVLKEFIYKNQKRVLILLDGFDEFQISTLDTSSYYRKQSTDCWVVITSRPPLDKLVNSSWVEKPYTHVAVESFSYMDIENYVNKFFNGDHDKASKLINKIKLSNTLYHLAMSPMLLLLMCLLWDAENTLPDTMTRLYNKAMKYIFKRKTTDIEEDEISETLIAIGKVALDRLISEDKSFAFREGDFEKNGLKAAITAGVLTSERLIHGLEVYHRVSFIHHTFLKYCAAMYWQSLIKTEEFNKILDKVNIRNPGSSRYKYMYLLRFCCGDNETCTDRILKEVFRHSGSQLALIFYFESQSKKLPPTDFISSVLSDKIFISQEDSDSGKALLYFLKRVTALSRGNDFFSKVKKLEWSMINFQRFGKDLVKLIKLMTNLRSLSLDNSSLTSANIEEILSSLASPSTLTDLDLHSNYHLGGSLSSLTKLKCLQNLHIMFCSLVAQDVSPIAKSMGETLVHLSLEGNKALGGCASIWAPQLGKMECLQNVDFAKCSLKRKDIEPIAVALSGVSTLVNIDLSNNHDLRGCAELWALHLKRMRHLKEVTLMGCLLREDVEPIAVALSDIQTLADLNLAFNSALGGYASVWALHLKKMSHLMELKLSCCNLTEGDMQPIAESVSDMSTLIHLKLNCNHPLKGCALSWAPPLMQMTKHLRKLEIHGLTDEDKEHITASMGLNSTILDI